MGLVWCRTVAIPGLQSRPNFSLVGGQHKTLVSVTWQRRLRIKVNADFCPAGSISAAAWRWFANRQHEGRIGVDLTMMKR
jgi:hypothetical protein